MKFKEINKQKYYMRNVYINQIMKPEFQNNLNYAYFENSGTIPNYTNNPNIDLNHDNIFFNNNHHKTIYQNYYPNQEGQKKHKKGNFSQKRVNKNDIYYQNNFMDLNEANLFVRNLNKKSYEPNNNFNDRSVSENKMNNFNRTQVFFKKKEKNIDNISNMKINRINKTIKTYKNEINNNNDINDIYFFDNNDNENKNILKKSCNETISSRNKSIKNIGNSGISSRKSFFDEKNKIKNYQNGKNTYVSDKHKNTINQINNIICVNNACTTSPNSNNDKFKKDSNNNKIFKYYNNNLSKKNNQINSYKNMEQFKNPSYKSKDKNSSRNIINYQNYVNNVNNYESPQRINDENLNSDNISSINSPSVPSYSSVIEDNTINSKNYIWVKKNIRNNTINSNIEKNYLPSYYKKPNINQDNSIQQNLINFANDITNINSYLYNTEVIFPNFNNKKMLIYNNLDLFEQSATLIQSTFRAYLVKKKFDSFYSNYKYYFHKGLEILELILNYFFLRNINIRAEKQKFFKYLITVTKTKNLNNKNRTKKANIINKKHKSFNNFKMINSPFSPVIKNGKIVSKFYHNVYLHKEIGERFNIIKKNNREEDIEKRYKEKIDVINIKVNKLTKENNILKDMNQKNVINERRYREISKDNKKKDDIISIITNDNKTLARKLKIIQDKFNKLQIQNQDYINYNSANQRLNNNDDINLFEEYRNLFLLFQIHKSNERYYLSILRKRLYKWRLIALSSKNSEKVKIELKYQKLKKIIAKIINKEKYLLHKIFLKFKNQSSLSQKEIKNKNNIIKYKLLHILKNKEKKIKSLLKLYFNKFYYKGIIYKKSEINNKNIIEIKDNDYGKIKKLLDVIMAKRHNRNILREYFIKWHLYTKVIALKNLINDKRKKKRQKQKMKKKIENEANNKYLTNNKILHFGKSNIYILNKEKEKELLISLDDQNQKYLASKENINVDDKMNNIIQATNKLGEIFYKAASKYQLFGDKSINRCSYKDNNDKSKINQNIDNNNNNDIEEEEDSGDSFGL